MLAELAEDLAATLVTALRKRMTNDSGKDGTERVTAAYRDWRGARTERLCADLALRAFHAGVGRGRGRSRVALRRRARRAAVRAVHARSARRTGAGATDVGRLPPLHAGCRCTVLPA